MSHRILLGREAKPAYSELIESCLSQFRTFPGFRLMWQRSALGEFEVHRRYRRETHLWINQGRTAAALTIDRPHAAGPAVFGNVLVRDDLPTNALCEFVDSVRTSQLKEGDLPIGPVNGHFNLGIGYPEKGLAGDRIAFLTSAPSSSLDRFYYETGAFQPMRRLDAYRAPVNGELRKKLEGSRGRLGPEFTHRSWNRLFYRREIKIYNQLVNQCLRGHYLFSPLSFREEWELMAPSRWMFRPRYVRFLLHRRREIGFCLAVPDFQPVLGARGDVSNFIRLSASKPQRARIIYSGILPEYRGQGLFRDLRHRVMEAMMEDGVTEIESSYIDQDNTDSRRNVESTGGSLSHSFYLFKMRSSQ